MSKFTYQDRTFPINIAVNSGTTRNTVNQKNKSIATSKYMNNSFAKEEISRDKLWYFE